MSNPTLLPDTAHDRASRGDLAVHDHICGIYDTREEQYEPAFRFLEAGLERKQRSMYITEQQTPAEFIRFLEKRGMNVKEAVRNGSLQVMSGKEVRVRLGGFTPAAMFSFLAQAETEALESGFEAFRWGAEMTWLRKDDIELAEMFSFEAELNTFLQEHELIGLCQYAVEDFRSELLIAAAETHPLLVYNDLICDNFYYVPPEEYLKPQFSEAKLQRILFNIVSRERLMQKFLSE